MASWSASLGRKPGDPWKRPVRPMRMNKKSMNAWPSSSKSWAEVPTNSAADTLGTRYYQLRKSCCLELNITLCLAHLTQRIKSGWTLDKDRGADSQGCYDCKVDRAL